MQHFCPYSSALPKSVLLLKLNHEAARLAVTRITWRDRFFDQRPAGVPNRVDEADLDIEVPDLCEPSGLTIFEGRLVVGEGEFSELLHLVDDELVDADLGERQHVIPSGLQPIEVVLEPLLRGGARRRALTIAESAFAETR
jgi:hypothetical protein